MSSATSDPCEPELPPFGCLGGLIITHNRHHRSTTLYDYRHNFTCSGLRRGRSHVNRLNRLRTTAGRRRRRFQRGCWLTAGRRRRRHHFWLTGLTDLDLNRRRRRRTRLAASLSSITPDVDQAGPPLPTGSNAVDDDTCIFSNSLWTIQTRAS